METPIEPVADPRREEDLDPLAASMRRERAVRLLLPLFFVSGATALVYQTLWVRQLHLVFGTSTFAISTVLAAFMAGLAIGGAVMARYADRIARPLAAYGVLEAVIGVYALVFPAILALLTPVYLAAWRALEPTLLGFAGVQFVLVGAALLLPTAAMGATLPLLARFATERLGAAGDRIGTLYGVNTAGAVFGTWACGFVLLPALGLWTTTVLAAAANLALAAAAIGVGRWAGEAARAEVDDDLDENAFDPQYLPILVVMGLAGFASLVYEIAWARVLGLMLGGSVYVFSVMLLAFLVGIALGGKLGGPIADRALRRGGLARVLVVLAGVEVGVAVLSYLLMYLYPELPFWYVWLFDWLDAAGRPGWMWVVSLVLSGAIMTPPAVLMGVAFPVAVRAVIGRSEALGGPVGRVYAANTFGAVLGATLAGFVLLPWLHVQGTVFVAAAANLLAAGVAVARWRRLRREEEVGNAAGGLAYVGLGALVVVLGMVALRPPWDPMLMTAGMYKYVTSFRDHSREGILRYAVEQYELLYYEEGLSSVVTVARNRESGNIWLANNGKVEASTTVDMPTQVLVSLLPFQFAEDPDDVLVIGLASGITAGAVTLVDDVRTLEVVELEPAIEQAARFFSAHNHQVLDDPRTRLVTNDGRNHVLLAAPGTWDVIVSEPSNPWISGVSNLFTREFFELGRSRLKEGGVWAQWVQMYGMGRDDLRSLLATFADVYPYVLLYATVEDADLVLLGSESPIAPTPAAAAHLLERWPGAAAELGVVGIETPMELVALFQMDRDDILELAGDAPLNTDDNMRIEYSAPLHLHVDTQVDNFELLLEHTEVPLEAIGTHPTAMAELARAYRHREDWVRAISAMATAAYQSEGAVRDGYIAEAEGWQKELEAELAAAE